MHRLSRLGTFAESTILATSFTRKIIEFTDCPILTQQG
jgi:hypothetical protein